MFKSSLLGFLQFWVQNWSCFLRLVAQDTMQLMQLSTSARPVTRP